jgi:outer membrane lipoprotein-sorting protein
MLLGGVAAAADPPAPAGDDDLARIAAAAQAVKTVQGTFEQRTYNPDDPDHPEVRKGQFFIRPPDHYDLLWTKPKDPDWRERFCSDGQHAWRVECIDPAEQPAVSKHVVGEGDSDLRRILDCVRGDLAALGKEFSIGATSANGGYTLALTPTSDEAKREVASLTVQLGADYRARSLSVEQPSGTRIVVQVESAEYDKPIDDAQFHVPGQ